MIESNTLPSWAYGDPEQVAIRRQEEAAQKEKACGPCRNRVSFHWNGEEIVGCSFKRMIYGRRCEHFRRSITREENE